MNRLVLLVAGVLFAFGSTAMVHAGQVQAPTATAPAFVRLDGVLQSPQGGPRTGSVVMVVSLYATVDDPQALWSETQTVTLDESGRYTVFVGASRADGLPVELFANNSAQWVGLAVQGEPELPRVRVLSVPYALSAANADRLGGAAVSEFVMRSNLAEGVRDVLNGQSTASSSEPGVAVSTAGAIAKFSDSSNNTVDSNIFESSGRIGVATTSPLATFQVRTASGRNVAIYDAAGASTIESFNDAGATNTELRFQASMFTFATGNVGIGTNSTTIGGGFVPRLALSATYPALSLNTTSGYKWGVGLDSNGNLDIFESTGNTYSNRLFVTRAGNVGIGTNAPFARLQIRMGSSGNLAFYDVGGVPTIEGFTDSGAANTSLRFQASQFNFAGGNLGVGISTPSAKLHVSGDALFDGNIAAKYQDVAEWVDAPPLEDGTVVIVDPDASNRVVSSTIAYDTRVAGAVSRQPGLTLGERGDNKELIAQSGRVRIKVDASYGAIRIGDLLVTSPTPGHAMRSTPMKIGKQQLHRPGTLLGKALEALPSGRGEILVLLTLQ